ncbi:MAG: glucose-6-phosphate dehydrogenase assembly protein OpcA [Chlamydiia bacterium]|nr:glucose-6-phosphate dehydrogenase assembly protein OpcA [Chlamydiia bacterium]
MSEKEHVTVGQIEDELTKLWESDPDQNRIKACLFNLIIYTHEKRREEYFRNLVDTIIEKFPCRVIFIQADGNANENHLSVDVSNATFIRGDLTVACDQITIQAAGEMMERIPFIVTPHLVPDLPIYLFWGQDPTLPNETYNALEKLASRVIFDSDCTKNLQTFARQMLDILEHSPMEYMDMHWGFTGGWRDAISHVFDTPELIASIRSSTSIQLIYNNKHSEHFLHNDTKAAYLQAWLAAQLGWKYKKIEKEGGAITIIYQNGSNDITISMIPEIKEDLPSGAILEIEFATTDNLFFTLARNQLLRKIIVHVSTLEKCELPFALPMHNVMRGLNFMKEIFYQPTSSHYRNMLKMLSTIEWNQV